MATSSTEEKPRTYTRTDKIVYTLLNAGGGAMLGSFASILVSSVVWGISAASMAILIGPPVGFIAGGITALVMIKKEKSLKKVFLQSILVAMLFSVILTMLSL